MAIREYGESLLQDVRKRKDDQASAARKRQKKADLLQLGGVLIGAVGSSKLTNQFNSFNQNKEVLDTNIMITQAEKIDKQIDGVTTKLEASKLSGKSYFIDEQANLQLEQALSDEKNLRWNATPELQEQYKKAYKSQFLKLEEVKKLGEEAYERYSKSLEAQTQLKGSGTKAEAFKLAQSRLSTSPLTAFFGSAKREAEAVEAYRSSAYAQSAANLMMFDQILKDTGGDFVEAREIANTFGLDKDRSVQGALQEYKTSQSVTDDGMVIIAQTPIDMFTGELDIANTIIKKIDERTDEAKTTQLNLVFNVTTQFNKHITDKGRKLGIEKGFKAGATTVLQRTKNLEIYRNLLGTHPVRTYSERQLARDKTLAANLLAVSTSKPYIDARVNLAEAEKLRTQAEAEVRKNNEGLTEEQLNEKYVINSDRKEAISDIIRLKAELLAYDQAALQSVVGAYPELDPDNANGVEDNPFEQTGAVTEVEAVTTGNTRTDKFSVVDTTSDAVSVDANTGDSTAVTEEVETDTITEQEINDYKNYYKLTDISNEEILLNDSEALTTFTNARRRNTENREAGAANVTANTLQRLKKKATKKLESKIYRELTPSEKQIYNRTKKYPADIVREYKNQLNELGLL
jgi:hypothetical protein